MRHTLRLTILFSLIFALSLLTIQPAHAQEGDTPAAVKETAINNLNRAIPNIGRPTSWRHIILGDLSNSALGCSLISGIELNNPVKVYQIWLTYDGAEYLYHVSEDGILVQPCDPNIPATSSSISQPAPCDSSYVGYLHPRLHPNGEGRVVAGGVPNRVRIEPSVNANILFQLEPSTSFNIIGGPQCSEGVVWWMVQSALGTGWTAESNVNDGNAYYLEPSGTLSNIPLTAENIATATRINSKFDFVSNFDIDAVNEKLLLTDYATLKLYDLAIPDEMSPQMVMSAPAIYFDMSQNGQYIASGSFNDGVYAVNFWNTVNDANWIPDQTLNFSTERGLMDVSVSNTGIVAVAQGILSFSGTVAGPVVLWNGNTNTELISLQHSALVTDIAFNDAGSLLATSTISQGTLIWSVPDGILLATLTASGIPTFSPDGNTLAIGGYAGSVSFWNTTNFMSVGSVPAFAAFDIWESAVTGINYSQDGSLLVVGRGLRFVDGGAPEGFTADVKVIDIATQTMLATFTGDQSYINDVAFSPNGTALIVNDLNHLYYYTIQP